MLLPHVKAYIERHGLLTRGQALAVGVSGGPDSLVLLHLLTRLRPDYDLKLRAAHLHHGLRPGADAEAEFVAGIAQAWDVPCTVEKVDVAALAKAERLSLEEAGRRARYAFFARLAPVAAVAHTADDQAETVLMHFLRGAGMAGLRGMLPKTESVIRPLLATSRRQVEDYAAAHQLAPRIDPTNLDVTFFRNRLRHELLPLLEGYNPNIREILCRTAQVAAGEYELLQRVVEAARADMAQQSDSPGVLAFHLTRWRAQPPAMQRALLRSAVDQLRPGLRDVDFAPIDHAVRWAQTAQSGHTADVAAGLCLKVIASSLVLCEWDRAREERPPAAAPLAVPGETTFLGWHATAQELKTWDRAAIDENKDEWMAYLDAALAPFELRTRRPGDRFQPLGMAEGSMKLSDFMINRKIAVDKRGAWPLLASGGQVVWVCGCRLSHRARVTAQTKRVIRVALRRLGPTADPLRSVHSG